MTEQEILALPANRETDALVARLLGHTNVRLDPDHIWECLRDLTPSEAAEYARCGVAHNYLPVADYSTDLAAAGKVVEWFDTVPLTTIKNLLPFGPRTTPILEITRYRDAPMTAGCWMVGWAGFGYEGESAYFGVDAPTLPLAICRAALLLQYQMSTLHE